MRLHLSPRFRTRSFMALTALIALILAAPREIDLRKQRRHWARTREYHLSCATSREELARRCRSATRRWIRGDREIATSEVRVLQPLPKLSGWDEEAAWHDQAAASFREAAAVAAGQERAIRRQLIFPVIFDIKGWSNSR